METIFDSKNIDRSILGTQEIKSDAQYRLLRFCAAMEIDGRYFLYNKMTGKIFLLTDGEYGLLKSGGADSEALKAFIEEWCVVPDNNDDIKLADQFLAVRELLKGKPAVTSFTILTTTDCNARCFYCYEMGAERRNMSEQTARDVADYIIRKSGGAKVSLKWFGGEPLFNSAAIDIICKALAERGVEYRSSMISNAYLFDDKTVKRAAELWRLKGVQVTLDGTAERYNRIKAYYKTDDENPFKTVTDNIERLTASGIRVSIRLNLSEENYDDLVRLTDWLGERYKGNKNLTAYSALLYDIYEKDDKKLSEMLRLNISLDERLARVIGNRGIALKALRRRGCMAQNDGCVVISPVGTLGKCEHFVEGEKTFGSIYSDKQSKGVIAYWKHQASFEECKKCSDYLICGRYDSCPNFKRRCDILKIKREYNDRRGIICAFEDYNKKQSGEG